MMSDSPKTYPVEIRGQQYKLRVWKDCNHVAVCASEKRVPCRFWHLCVDHIEWSSTIGQATNWQPGADQEVESKLRELGYLTARPFDAPPSGLSVQPSPGT